MLNAFRHQRSDHRRSGHSLGPRRRAQRLSASKIRSHFKEANAFVAIYVLNAFRHQRSDHGPWAPTPTPRSPRSAQRLSASKIRSQTSFIRPKWADNVLNAFRHQRSDHSKFAPSSWPPRLCSTPFGIKDQITQRRRRRGAQYQLVLNAFRHQRSDHRSPSPRSWLGSHRAQRLSASKIRSPQ